MKKTISISRSIRMVPLLFVILFAAATLVDSEHCPPAANILPCQCDGDPDIKHVVCINLTSVDHLKHIVWGHHFCETIPHLVLQNLPFSTLPYLGLYQLTVVDLEILDGNISHFPREAIRSQPYLLSIRVDRNRLEDVPEVALNFLWYQLKILSMSGNVLKKLGPTSLRFMYALEELTLSENEISEVARDSLPKYVQYLWISRNKLTTFNGSLHHTKKLKHLDASNNNLTSMKGQFDGLLCLQTVILDHNHISDISDTFSNLDSVRELSLVGNGILEVGEALADLRHLTHLNLSRNAITNLSRTAFGNLIDLYDLNLSENPLTAFQICPTLKPLRSLRILNLSNSNLEGLPPDCFDNNTNLGIVDLSRNRLSVLGLTYATNLTTLDISFNNFKFVHNLELPRAGSATLILEDNPWWCWSNNTFGMRFLDESGYFFPSGYPTCFREGKKPLGCITYN